MKSINIKSYNKILLTDSARVNFVKNNCHVYFGKSISSTVLTHTIKSSKSPVLTFHQVE